jgi:D-alanyl-D-alanine carboxypeptidase/D-alanyl-D-alanine-endopeptidase (penicillin-binding protein 4)
VTKIVTAATVLHKLTPAHTFKTRFFYTGARKGERIDGDLVIVGDGDPFLVSEKLWQLAADFQHMGIKEFGGGIVIDNSLFGDPSRDDSRLGAAAQSVNAYDAPVSALGVNFNTFAIAVAPGLQTGKPAAVFTDPYPLKDVVIENKVITGAPHTPKSLQVRRIAAKGREERLLATGTIGLGEPVAKIYRSVGDHVAASGETVRAFLQAAGIKLDGPVKEGVKPAGATPLFELESYDLRRIVAGLNTFSNNFIADVLVKRLGAAFPRRGEPDGAGQGTYANGLAVLKDFLRDDVGIKTEFVLENGSGLATENRLTARQVTAVLQYMERRMEVFPEFLGSLPATGWDGTMKKRFSKGGTADFKGLFRAKTGTLTAPVTVVGVAGYFRHPEYGLAAFCILENGNAGKKQPSVTALRDRQDEILVALMGKLE